MCKCTNSDAFDKYDACDTNDMLDEDFRERVTDLLVDVSYTDVFNILADINMAEFAIDKVINNDRATIIFWDSGEKTIVKRMEGQENNLHYAFCAAVCKKLFGSSAAVNRMVGRIEIQKPKVKKLTDEEARNLVIEYVNGLNNSMFVAREGMIKHGEN